MYSTLAPNRYWQVETYEEDGDKTFSRLITDSLGSFSCYLDSKMCNAHFSKQWMSCWRESSGSFPSSTLSGIVIFCKRQANISAMFDMFGRCFTTWTWYWPWTNANVSQIAMIIFGHVIDSECFEDLAKKIDAIPELEQSTDGMELWPFLGRWSFFCCFLQKFCTSLLPVE